MEQLVEKLDTKLLRIEPAVWLEDMPRLDGLNKQSSIRELELDRPKRRRSW